MNSLLLICLCEYVRWTRKGNARKRFERTEATDRENSKCPCEEAQHNKARHGCARVGFILPLRSLHTHPSSFIHILILHSSSLILHPYTHSSSIYSSFILHPSSIYLSFIHILILYPYILPSFFVHILIIHPSSLILHPYTHPSSFIHILILHQYTNPLSFILQPYTHPSSICVMPYSN